MWSSGKFPPPKIEITDLRNKVPKKKVHGERRKEERHRSDGGFHCGDEYSSQLHEAIELAKDTGNSSDVNLDESSGSETELEASVRHLTGVQLHPPAAKRLRTITPSGGGSGMNLDESDSDSDSGEFLLHRQSPTASTWQQHQAVHDSSSDDSESADLQLEAEDSGMSDVFGNSSSGDDDGND